jgi:hypothetical protein
MTDLVDAAVRLFTRIREVFASNLGRNIGCAEVFLGFPQSVKASACVVSRLDHDRLSKSSLSGAPDRTSL